MDEQQEPQTFAPIVSATKTGKKKAALLTLLVIVLVAGSGGGAYYWQHDQYTKTNKKLTNANVQITSLQSQLSSVQSKYNKDQATIQSENSSSTKATPATQSDLTVTINGAEYVNPDGATTASSSWFGVNATFTNNTSSTISISDSNFTLKDAQGNQYTQETAAGSSTLPSGWVALSDTTVAAGSTVKGTIVFQMPNTTTKSFTFTNDTKTYSVTSTN